MLIIGRKTGESVWIGKTKVTILAGRNIGIEGPRDVKVVRSELLADETDPSTFVGESTKEQSP